MLFEFDVERCPADPEEPRRQGSVAFCVAECPFDCAAGGDDVHPFGAERRRESTGYLGMFTDNER